ncbi:hypothetical protein [Pseudooceanicola atlanticus]|uniref:hypothetical protein n=1 Tax=Pseudooceanicola atlanticus TaxID=1461694 RepID=UPI000ADD903A|nr:hypothetical protein [Pseudooceanicola atlanticus]
MSGTPEPAATATEVSDDNRSEFWDVLDRFAAQAEEIEIRHKVGSLEITRIIRLSPIRIPAA